MNKPLSDLEDSELDRIVAELIKTDIPLKPLMVVQDGTEFWKPTQDYNQIFRYLLPELKKKGIRTKITFGEGEGSPDFVAMFFGNDKPIMEISFRDQLYRSLVIAIIEAFRQIGGEE